MKKKYKNILLFGMMLFFMFSTKETFSRHIVGGDVIYECLGVTGDRIRFNIVFTMYRDSKGEGAQFDSPARFGLFKGLGSSWNFERSYRVEPKDIAAISLDTGNPCLDVPTNVGVEKAVYEFQVEFEISSTQSYMISYQRCCRNNTIFNIIEPDVTGAMFSATISPFAQQECDNSAIFDGFPPVIICANTLLNFDHSATDIDGDQIVYSFCAPISAGGTTGVNFGDPESCDGITPDPSSCGPINFRNVTFRPPAYSFDKPLGIGIVINQSTGLISGIPQTIGQFVVGVCATSFRNGVEIGVLTRDFQFNVTTCEIAVQASIGATEIINGEKFIIHSCGENTIDFVNLSTDESKIFSYDWELYVNDDTIRFDTRNINYTFPDTGRYTALMLLNNEGNFENCKDTAFININIYPDIIADFGFTYDTCLAGPVDFVDLSETDAGNVLKWDWLFEENETSDTQNPSHIFQTPGVKLVKIAVEDKNECRDSIEKDIVWFPVPPLILVEPNNFTSCIPASISFNNLSTPIDETYDVIWDFGDGTIVNELSPTHVYNNIGWYTVNVTITSPIGCEIEQSFGNWIEVLNSPTAGFRFTPDNPSIFNKRVEFFDESIDATGWLWNFGGVGILEEL